MSGVPSQDILNTIDMLKGVYSGGPAALAPDIVKDFNSALGLIPYNLEPGAKLLAPVITPLRNMIPRTKGHGKATEFKAITSYNSSNVASWASEGTSGAVVDNTSVDVLMAYKIQSLKQNITFEAQYAGQGQIDAKALAVANLLRAFMIKEEDNILFGQNSVAVTGASAGGQAVSIGGAVGTPSAPTTATATTGGTVAAGTYNTYQTVVTGNGESLPSVVASQVTSGSTSTLTVSPTVVQSGLVYNLYVKISTDTTFVKYTTNGKPVVITAYTPVTNTGLALPVADTSASTLAFPGIIPQLLAVGSGASVRSINGVLNMGTGGQNPVFGDLDNLLLDMWNVGRADPDWILCNAFESLTITSGTLGAGTPYFIQPDGAQNGAVGGFRVSRFTNKVTGTLMDIKVHPTLFQGTLLALSTKLPAWYPGSDIPSVWSMEMLYDYLELDYPPTSPQWPVEVRNMGALLLYLPLVQGVIKGISKT